MGKTGAADTASESVNNPLRYAYRNGTAALAGFMDYSARLVNKDDLQGTEGCEWTDEDRSFFWAGNPVSAEP